MTTVIVDTVTLEFMNYWPSDLVNPPTVIGPNPQVALETSEDPLILMAVREEDGSITLTTDPAKVEAKRQAQIATNKSYRDLCLKMTDFTMLPDTGLDNVQEWVSFRASLRAIDLDPPVTWPQEPQSPWGPFLPSPPTF